MEASIPEVQTQSSEKEREVRMDGVESTPSAQEGAPISLDVAEERAKIPEDGSPNAQPTPADAPEEQAQKECPSPEQVPEVAAEQPSVADSRQSAVQVVHVPVAALEKQEKPKRPSTAFWIFSQGVREHVSQEQQLLNGGAKPKLGELAKVLAAKWASLPAEERKVWEDKAAADKQRYEAEMQIFSEGRDPAAALRLKFQHLIPKKPPSAYFLFCQDSAQRDSASEALKGEGKEVGSKQISAKLAELWKAAGSDVKARYQEQMLEQNLEFLEKQKVWQATPEYSELCQVEKEQEVLKKAVAAQKAREESERQEREAREKRAERKRKSAGKADITSPPAKKARGTQSLSSKTPPKGTRSKGAAVLAEPRLDEKVLAEAKKLGLEASFRNLSARPDVLASGKTARNILGALQASNGLVNPAKRALLGL